MDAAPPLTTLPGAHPRARRRWRENAPLYTIAFLLACVFAALALVQPHDAARAPDAAAPAGRMAAERAVLPAHAAALAALPASAEDKLVVASALAPDSARARNASVAFAAAGPGAARPFAFRGTAADRVRAQDCLALAAMAEAGGGDGDQRAVMQVILNRVRHPAFAHTVCGVVYQGSDRPTGCQFSFTCDGSLARHYSAAAWTAARRRADEALGGYVHGAVGNATHYHADYVYPWWSAQLDKVAAVGPHLFFRWRGFWGSAAALNARYAGGEPDPAPLREEAVAVAAANPLPLFTAKGEALRTITARAAASGPGQQPSAREGLPLALPTRAAGSPAPGVHLVLVSAADSPAALVERARQLCPASGGYCQVYGWDDAAAIPSALPLPREARQRLRFSFLAARGGSGEAIYLDCRVWSTPAPGTCLPRAAR